MSMSLTMVSVKPAEIVAVLSMMLVALCGIMLDSAEALASLGAAMIGAVVGSGMRATDVGEGVLIGAASLSTPWGRGEIRFPVG